MDFGPKGYVNDRHGDCLMLCAYNARTVFTNADLYALFEAAGRINHVFALQTKSRKRDVRQLSGGTLIIREEKVPSRNEALVLSYICCPSCRLA
ncbi:unnamed protein product [Strongylus vulgaris]|uniref:Uncharacterized protein n=1 Tax=Strongylus vulgaris TaxID=40348 RepID=A0A3P7JIM7_STRVU|nr:unnamed protein product [Strongylus vulgaris]